MKSLIILSSVLLLQFTFTFSQETTYVSPSQNIEMNQFFFQKDHTGFQDFFGHVQNVNFIGPLWCKNKKTLDRQFFSTENNFGTLIRESFGGCF